MLTIEEEQQHQQQQLGRPSEKFCQWRPQPQNNGRIIGTFAWKAARDLVLAGLAVALLLVANGEYHNHLYDESRIGDELFNNVFLND